LNINVCFDKESREGEKHAKGVNKKGEADLPSNFNGRFSVAFMQNYFSFLHVEPCP
jgi:hypothetical protein